MTHGSRRRFPLAPCVIGSRIHRETLDGHASLVSLRRRTRVVLPFRHALDIFSSLPVSDWPQKSWLTRYFRRFRHRQSWNLLDRVRREAIVFFSFRRGESLRISRDNWIPSSSQHNFGLDYRSLLADRMLAGQLEINGVSTDAARFQRESFSSSSIRQGLWAAAIHHAGI